MRLATSRPPSELRSSLARLWHEAIRDVVIRHPNHRSVVQVHLTDDERPLLKISLDSTFDSRDPSQDAWSPFTLGGTRLTYFPGAQLARQWLAAAFSAYILHEAQELVTIGDLVTRPLDPHTETSAGVYGWDKGLRDGIPAELTPATLRRTLDLVGYPSAVEQAMGAA